MLFPLPEIKTQIMKVSHNLKLRILGEEGRGDVWVGNSNEVRLRLRERERESPTIFFLVEIPASTSINGL